MIAGHALKMLPAKQKQAWRPILGRLQLLTDLVSNYGVGSTGLSADSCMNYAKSLAAFSHSNGEVRDAARDMTVALYRRVGEAQLDSHLKVLRPKQLEEYKAAFVEASGGGGPRATQQQHPSSSSPHPHNHVTHNKGGHVNTSAEKASNRDHRNESQEADTSLEDFSTCSFCGLIDKSWNEDALDLHYWKECPLLSPCPGI